MKRRRFVQALATAPAVPALVAQQPASPAGAPRPAEEATRIDVTVADEVAETLPRFFSAEQYAALRKLSGILMPAIGGAPGALEAGAPEFLDFLIGASPAERQQLYRAGLDALNADARRQFRKPFAEVDAAQAAGLLKSLLEPWTHDPPADPLGRFLRAAKHDVRTATQNSREYNAAASAGGGRRFGGSGLYWYPIE